MDSSNKTRNSNLVSIWSHIIIWLLFIHLVYEISGLVESTMRLFYSDNRIIDEALLIIPFLIILFYWNSHYLVPKFLNSKSWLKYLIYIILALIGVLFSGYFLMELLFHNGYRGQIIYDPIDFFDFSLIQYLIIIGISTSLGVSKISIKNAQEKREALENQKVAELNFLKAQVSPHFLFNTLNTIYSLANDEQAIQTSDAILKLSENMRYIVNEASNNFVPLQREIDFLQSYVSLQEIRIAGNANIQFKIKGEIIEQKIAPLILISFVENVFKHGISYDQDSTVIISINIDQQNLSLKTENVFKRNQSLNQAGVSVQNTLKRLEYLYPNEHYYHAKVESEKYIVELSMELVNK